MKKVVALVLSIMMALSLAACGGNGASSAGAEQSAASASSSAVKPIKLVCAHGYPSTSDEQKYLTWIADELEKRTDGAITMTCVSDGQMGSESEIEAQTVSGVIDVTLGEGSAWADVVGVPSLGVFGLPYLYTSLSGLKNAGLNDVKDNCEQIFEQNKIGLKAFEPFSGGLRGVWTINKPIRHPSDLSGLKIRVPEIKLFVDTLADMGASPTTIAFTEVYTALSQGVVEGLEIDADTGAKNNLQEVCKYYTHTNHLGSLNIICMNLKRWNSLTPEQQKIFSDLVTEAASKQYDEREKNIGTSEQTMKDAGMEIIDMTAEEIASLTAAVKPIWEQYRNDYGVGDIIDQLSAAGAQQ